MEPMEIILLIAGGLIFILSFFISDGKRASGERKALSEGEAARLAEQELAALRGRIDALAQEALGEAMEKTERSLERLSNEKIMAVNEYSDTVLAEIHRNHEEAVFLYDMLNNKHASLKNALGDINRAVKEAEAAREALQHPVREETAQNDGSEKGAWGTETAGWAAGLGAAAGNGESAAKAPESQKTEPSDPSWVQTGQERNNNMKILELYKQGKPIVGIAKELDLGVGEVKLVVDLFKNQ